MTARPNSNLASPAANTPEIASDGLPQVIWRHKWVVVCSFLFAVAIGLLAAKRSVPMWSSYSKLGLDQGRSRLLGTDASTISDPYLHAQCELLKSTPILKLAAESLKSSKLETFKTTDDVPAALQQGLDTSVGKDDNIILVSYSTPYRLEGPMIVDAVVNAYITSESKHRHDTATSAADVLRHEVDDLTTRNQQLQQQIVTFRQKNPTISFDVPDKGNIVNQRLAQISTELTEAQFSATRAKAHFDSLTAQAAANPIPAGKIDASDADVDPAWVRSEIDKAKGELVNELTHLSEQNPAVQATRDHIARLREMLISAERGQRSAVLASAAAELDTANRREADLEKQFKQQQTDAGELNGKVADYNRMAADLERGQQDVAQHEDQIKQMGLKQDAAMDVRIVEPAKADTHPQGTKSRILGMAGILGLLLGVGLSLGLDVLDQRMRSPEDARALGLPLLGVIPHQPGKLSVAACGLLAYSDPMSEAAEAARSVRTAVFFASRSTPVKTVLVASPSHGDGKSTFASNLAIAMAQAGTRTLLLDANFREPVMHKIFEIHAGAGLSEVLAGQVALDKAISRTPVEGLEVLPAGPIPRNPSEMLNGPAFAKMIEQLSERYQCILIDSPPVLSVTDARILGATADLTLYVIRTGSTSRKAADQGLDNLLSVGARVLGAVANDDVRRRRTPRPRGAFRFLETIEQEPEISVRNGRAKTNKSTTLGALGMSPRTDSAPEVDVLE